ncbi:hypothetical protein BDE02_07G044400 [Populus trichocarpa]|nr:hypothetical protein BDE02_07G044400 [Populus trichocarpa]
MARNLGKENSSSVRDLQDPSITGSGHKQRRGSVQPSSSKATKKTKKDINSDYLKRKKNKAKKLKAKRKTLERSNSHLEGQAYQLRKDQKEVREENIKLMIGQKSQSDSMLELEKNLIAVGEKINALKEEHAHEIHALKEEHAQEIRALREELERQMQMCSSWHIDVGQIENAGEMNNLMETPTTAQATSYFFNDDHFASQMA